ncbi:MAG TPA: biopolymer transporter ExbD [Gammaproteobacteria bacterium]
MARGRNRSVRKDPPELDITTFLNLMVVLVPFLLITAVFSRITILQLDLPQGAGADSGDDKKITIEVIVRDNGIDIGDGSQIVTRFPKTEDGFYDITAMTSLLREIKRNFPNKLDAIVLMEPDLEYEILVQIMDAVSGAEVPDANGEIQKVELFPQISVGDAPALKTTSLTRAREGQA